MVQNSYTTQIVICLTLLLALRTSSENNFEVINGLRLGKTFREFADECLGIRAFQEHVDQKVTFSSHQTIGNDLLEKLRRELGEELDRYNTAVKRLREAIELAYRVQANVSPFLKCCGLTNKTLPDLTFSPEFQAQVSLRGACLLTVPELARPFPGVVNAVFNNFRNQSLQNKGNIPRSLWQYYANELSYDYTYPAFPNCVPCEPTIRPWYLEAFAPEPKDIVLVVDASNDHYRSWTSEAAMIVLGATNPNDRVGLVMFAFEAWTPSGSADTWPCYGTKLATATPKNVAYLKWVLTQTSIGPTTVRYVPAIQRAFQMFTESGQVPTDVQRRRKILLFLTHNNPEPHRERILDVLDAGQRANSREVMVYTYAFGNGITPEVQELLRMMASSTNTSDGADQHTTGTFTHIKAAEDLRNKVTSYYSAFGVRDRDRRPIVTVPYQDQHYLGLVVSVCLPVYVAEKGFRGVTCIDSRVSDLFYNVTHFQVGKDSYAFLTDKRGRAIVHPLLSAPKTIEDDPVFTDISALEREPGAVDAIKSMLSGGNGTTTFRKNVRGAPGSGAIVHYHWAQVPNTDYSLCLVLFDEDVDLRVTYPYRSNVYVHPIHPTGTQQCLHRNLSVFPGSTVYFAAEAFQSAPPREKRDHQARRYMNVFRGDIQKAPEFRESVPATVNLMAHLDEIWRDGYIYHNSHINWRIARTVNGVVKIFPGGAPLPFDTTQTTPWYDKAISNDGLVVFSSVASDDAPTVMMSHLIYAERLSGPHSGSKPPLAVLSAELRPDLLQQLMEKEFPVCRKTNFSCFLVDEDARVIAHRDWFDECNLKNRPFNNHLMVWEPEIAMDLLQEDHMIKQQCNNWLQMHVLAHYKTNQSLPECKTGFPSGECQCPCYTPLRFNYCDDTFPTDSESMEPCPLMLWSKATFMPNKSEHIKPDPGLSRCFPARCHEMPTKRECLLLPECHWCHADGEQGWRKCLPRALCRPMKTTTSARTSQGLTLGYVIGISTAGLVIICLIGALLIVGSLLCRLKKSSTVNQTPSITGRSVSEIFVV